MLYNLDFLRQGEQFPPESEIKRLDGYRVNGMLYNDEAWNALPDYKKRVMYILQNFAVSSESIYLFSANHWADLVNKVTELIYGELPEVSCTREELADSVLEMLSATSFFDKAIEGVADFISLGDWVTKAVENKDNNAWEFINIDPSTWFPIVSIENVKDIKMHVLAWIAEVGKHYELHVQIHEKGKFTNRAFAISSYNKDSYYIDSVTNQKIACATYEIGKELTESGTDFKVGTFSTGLKGFAVLHSSNNKTARSIYGSSDFDLITDAAMEYNVRQTLKDVVLDKHTAPILSGPPLHDERVGNYIEVQDGQQTPNYLVWDASMVAVENTINSLKEDMANLSGLGSLLSSKTFGESQGYDALMIKLSPALMRAAAKKRVIETHLKKLIAMLSTKNGKALEVKEITILWHDGIPSTESARADVAQKHLNTGWSKKLVLVKDYGFTEEEAEAIIEDARVEQPTIASFGFNEEDEEQPFEGGDDKE